MELYFDVLLRITLNDIHTYRLMLCIPIIGKWTIKNQKYIKNLFTKKTIIEKNYEIYTLGHPVYKHINISSNNAQKVTLFKSNKFFAIKNLFRINGPVVEVIQDVQKHEIVVRYGNYRMTKAGDKLFNFGSNINKLCLQYSNIEMWFKNGSLHKTNGPAYICSDKNRYMLNFHQNNEEVLIIGKRIYWYYNDRIHRENGPACIYTLYKNNYDKNMHKECYYWYIKGKLHRNNKPALIMYNNTGEILIEEWYSNGILHRQNGPAIINYDNGTQIWYKNGKKQEWRIKNL